MNIRTIICTLCLLLGSFPAWAQRATLVFEGAGDDVSYPFVEYGQTKLKSVVEATDGNRVTSIELTEPAYVKVYFTKLDSRLCYVEPGSRTVLRYGKEEGRKSLTFTGDLAAENQYLQRLKWAGPLAYGRKASMSVWLAKCDSLAEIDKSRLAGQPFSETFKQWECKRIEVHALDNLLRMSVDDFEAQIAQLNDRIVKDASWLRIPDYRHLMDQYVRRLVRLGTDIKVMLEGEELVNKRIACIETYIHQPEIAGYLMDITLFHMSELNIPRYNDLYHRYVKDPERIALYDAATKKADNMAAGKPCPDFCFADNKGGKVRLADLRGKYVYIDLWATWCGPCKGEMPALLELEKKFEGKDLHFVSISIDTNKNVELWKKTIVQMGLGGCQLHFGEQWDWLKNFMPSSISVPRFLLLDREGRIVDAHAPRPSDRSLASRLEQLLSEGVWK